MSASSDSSTSKFANNLKQTVQNSRPSIRDRIDNAKAFADKSEVIYKNSEKPISFNKTNDNNGFSNIVDPGALNRGGKRKLRKSRKKRRNNKKTKRSRKH